MPFDKVPIGRFFKYSYFVCQKTTSELAVTRDGTILSSASISGDVELLPIIKESKIEIIPLRNIRLREWHKPRSRPDRGELAASVAAHGITNPLTITSDGYLVDGWFRYQACVDQDIRVVPVHRI